MHCEADDICLTCIQSAQQMTLRISITDFMDFNQSTRREHRTNGLVVHAVAVNLVQYDGWDSNVLEQMVEKFQSIDLRQQTKHTEQNRSTALRQMSAQPSERNALWTSCRRS